MKNFKPLLGIGMALIFIVIGFKLIAKQDQLSVIIGYANVIFWSCVILFAAYKTVIKKKNNI